MRKVEYACPQCGQSEQFIVMGTTDYTLSADGSRAVVVVLLDDVRLWTGSNDRTTCAVCGHVGTAGAFRQAYLEAAISWRELRIFDREGAEMTQTLGGVVEHAPEALATATLEQGRIATWPDYFLAAPGEEVDWDTPRLPVNWEGFDDALARARE
jgi:hypothetical protein